MDEFYTSVMNLEQWQLWALWFTGAMCIFFVLAMLTDWLEVQKLEDGWAELRFVLAVLLTLVWPWATLLSIALAPPIAGALALFFLTRGAVRWGAKLRAEEGELHD
jgi:hypothetical protein